MDDNGLNRWLEDTYGTTIDFKPLFRLSWSTNQLENRHSTFRDFHGDILIREVTETRLVPKYPMAPDRWVLERIHAVTPEAVKLGLVGEKMSYEEIYTFQDRNGNALPLNRNAVEAAMYLFFKFYLEMTPKERIDFRIAQLAEKDRQSKNQCREIIGELRAPHAFVLESMKGMRK